MTSRCVRITTMAAALSVSAGVGATVPNAADPSIRQFLSQSDVQHTYQAVRHLDAENGDRKGWIEARTEYSAGRGFSYEVISQGGSGYIRDRILRGVLEGERDMIARGDTRRSALAESN